MKKFAMTATAVAMLAGATAVHAMPGDQPGGERYCRQYAETTASVVGDALKRNPSCLDYSRGVHSNVKMHYDWCMRTGRGEVDGAGMHIRNLVQKCTAANRGGGNFGGNGGGNSGGGRTDPAFCQSYAQGMVALGAEAVRRNCLQYGPQGLHTNYQSHYNWCLGQSRSSATGAAAHVNRLLASCNR